ncbi:cytosolic iron-sulfur assembly component 2B isoform X3 [Crocuta crocuta]
MVGGGGVGGGLLENANPLIYERSGERPVTAGEEDEQVPDSIDARERPREHGGRGFHTHHSALQHGHPYWPVHQSQASSIPSPAFQDGCAHYTRNPCLGACSIQDQGVSDFIVHEAADTSSQVEGIPIGWDSEQAACG